MSTYSGIREDIAPHTTQLAPLGAIIQVTNSTYPDNGLEDWIYVKATVALVVGNVCIRPIAATVIGQAQVRKSLATSAPDQVVGVVTQIFASGEYGFIKRVGMCQVLAGVGGITINVPIVCDDTTPGTARESAGLGDGDSVATFGLAFETAASTALALCHVNCRG